MSSNNSYHSYERQRSPEQKHDRERYDRHEHSENKRKREQSPTIDKQISRDSPRREYGEHRRERDNWPERRSLQKEDQNHALPPLYSTHKGKVRF
jgi:hypothetical protein